MALDHRALELPRDPASVRHARVWVAERMRGIGRDDLVDAATLGVSELVTNAILHTESSIVVQLRGTQRHPRLEVRDSSRRPPRVNGDMTAEDHLLSTVGRGLALVAMYAAAWGSEIAGGGKLVWFEPAAETGEGGDPTGDVYDLDVIVDDLLGDELLGDDPDLNEGVPIHLLNMPVQVFLDYRASYDELMRELRILTLPAGTDHLMAREISALSVQVERDRRRAEGGERLDRAIADGANRTDVDYLVPAGTPARMGRMRDLLEEADEFCRKEELLVMAPTAQQTAMRRWYFGEFARQGQGADPTPWPGGLVVDQPVR